LPRRNNYYRGEKSDHFDGIRFHSPAEPPPKTVAEMSWILLGRARHRWPALVPSPHQDRPPERVQHLRLTAIGHASILVQVAGLNLLFDPVWSDRVGPLSVGPRRVNTPGIEFDDLPPIDAVLVTHNHYDHLDAPTISRLWRRFRPRIIAPLGNDRVVRRYDPTITAETYDWGDRVPLSDRLAAHLEPAFHWSGRGLRDRRMTLWCSFVLAGAGGDALFHVGDTAYGDGSIFRDIREKHGAPRVALLPIGAYEPRRLLQAQHVNPQEAVQIMRDCGAEQAFGHHWGTFRLTHEPVHAPAMELSEALTDAGIAAERFRPLLPGESAELAWEGTVPEPTGAERRMAAQPIPTAAPRPASRS
jgi:L-ascorbate metabolism protein UlaG (beta-lactamase superfamily)